MSASPASRGASDAWYGRPPNPHKWDEKNRRIDLTDPAEITAYNRSYDEAVADGMYAQKDWT